MFKSIVAGTDGSATAAMAVQQAAELAKIHGAWLHLVNAYRPVTADVLAPAIAGEALVMAAGAFPDPAIAAKELLEQATSRLSADGVVVQQHALPGPAAAAILKVAEDQQADLIVVGSRGMTGGRRLLGSVPNSVTHHAPCSVLVVNTD
jgi:nucleotide-binding universal stress UspA family protein